MTAFVNRAKPIASRNTRTGRWVLIGIVWVFLGIFLLLPLLNVFVQACSKGVGPLLRAVFAVDTRSAAKLTLSVALVSVPLNMVFGVAVAWLVAKCDFRGKSLLVTLLDLPFAVSPVVVGLMFVLLFGLQGYWGEWLLDRGIQVLFAWPAILLVTLFVTVPYVARELIPIMEATGREQEEAARILGASGWQTFWRVTLPSAKWGLLYGVILCNARAMGEFGAVSVVSGHIAGLTDTLPLRVEKLYQDYDAVAAFGVAGLLALMALSTLLVKGYLEWRQRRDDAGFEGGRREP